MRVDRRDAFTANLKPNFHEWDAVMNETLSLHDWGRSLPKDTTVVSAEKTVRPIREIAELMREHCATWRFETVPDAGHMAPLTHPNAVNPLIKSVLGGA